LETFQGFTWVSAEWLIAGEPGAGCSHGDRDGHVTHFRGGGPLLQYRLTVPGLVLWAVFIVVRAGFFALAARLDANL